MRARGKRLHMRVVERKEKLHTFEGGSKVDASIVASSVTHNDPLESRPQGFKNSLGLSCVSRTANSLDLHQGVRSA